jgi:hypothetical protein
VPQNCAMAEFTRRFSDLFSIAVLRKCTMRNSIFKSDLSFAIEPAAVGAPRRFRRG